MFIGHFGVAFGAKNAARTVSLGTLIMASQFIDLIWPTLLWIGAERVEIRPNMTVVTPLEFVHYPISHSLVMVLFWSFFFMIVHGLIKRNWGASMILGLCVFSHWVLDLIVHAPDLQIYPGGEGRLGFGLWNSMEGTFILEAAIFITGIVYYMRITEEDNGIGKWGLWALVFFLVVIWLGSIFGPPPPNMTTIIVVGHLQWLFVLLGYWIDRNRITDPTDVTYDKVPIGPRTTG